MRIVVKSTRVLLRAEREHHAGDRSGRVQSRDVGVVATGWIGAMGLL
jgi:hypothetical protein